MNLILHQRHFGLVFLLATCAACSSPTSSVNETDPFFPRQNPPNAYMEALLFGTLQIQERCLVVTGSEGVERVVPVWPPDYSLSFDEGDYAVLDGNGAIRIRVGQPVEMSGGFVPLEGLASLDDDVRTKLLDLCPGDYWFVGAEVRPLRL